MAEQNYLQKLMKVLTENSPSKEELELQKAQRVIYQKAIGLADKYLKVLFSLEKEEQAKVLVDIERGIGEDFYNWLEHYILNYDPEED